MNGIIKVSIFLFVLAFGKARPLGKIHRPYQGNEKSWGFDGDDKSPLTAKRLPATEVQEKQTGKDFLQSSPDLDMDDSELNSQYDKVVVKFVVSFKRSHTDDGDEDDDSNNVEIFEGFEDDDYDDEMYDEYEVDGDDDEICEDYDDGDDDCDDDDDEICHDCLGENVDDDKICDNLEDDDVDDDNYQHDDYDNVSDDDDEINVMLMMIDGTDNGGITYYDYSNDKPLIF